MLTNPLENFAAAFGRMRRRNRVGRSLTAMEMLNDHTLRDIGLHRCQIAGLSGTGERQRQSFRNSALRLGSA